AIINNILDFSSLEARGTVLEDLPFSLQACVDEAIAMVAPAAGALELVSYVHQQCPGVVVGDSHRLKQVLVNLLANAIKFTETGEVLLTVAPSEDDRGQSNDRAPADGTTGDRQVPVALSLSVRDTGIGIAPDRLDRLFTSFSQVDTSTTRLYGGSGLGLAISKSLVEAMGGTISVESAPGVGSTFRVDLVLPTDADAAVLVPTSTGTALSGLRMLVVDDNDTNRQVLRLQLEAAGVDVEVAGSGADALTALDGSSFDVAVLDMHMPGMDGAQLAARIRSRPATAALPLVLLTSLDSMSQEPGLFDAQHCKPVRAAALRAEVAEVLRRGQITARAAAGDVSSDAGPVAVHTPLRVLLVEDNVVNQSVGRAMLARLGHLVDVADNGRDALHGVQQNAYDVVLMDVHMPVMDGLEATSAMRAQLPDDRQPHIIALTASSLDQDRQACADAGMDGFLLKPVRLAQLADALRSAPARAAAPEAPGAVPSQASLYDGVHARLDDVLGPDRDAPVRRQLIEALLQQTPEHLAGLAVALARSDTAAAAALAHTLKGLLGNLGATTLAGLSGEVEVLAGLGQLAGTDGLLERMRHEYELLRQALA
nr:response regulator [Nocardioidaceae bacterium]